MPRKARIDAPGALHHVITRGIEKRDIFWDDHDRNNFLERLGTNPKVYYLSSREWVRKAGDNYVKNEKLRST